MFSPIFIIFVLCLFFGYPTCGNGEAILEDTYINALHNSHQTVNSDTNSNDGGGGYEYTNSNNYLPPATSAPSYYPEKPIYGPPIAYNPPPQLAPIYGLPEVHHQHITYRGNWLLEKLKTKLNLFAIGKIILKLLIFKKIVKFIGIICLLLFLPKLKNLFKDNMNMDDERMRSIITSDQELVVRRISELLEFVENSITKYD